MWGWETEGKGRVYVGELCVGLGKGEERGGVRLIGDHVIVCSEFQH